MTDPLVSVIIPTYNYAQYISEAITSVLDQDYPPDKLEIIVIDDGSTDNTKEVLTPFIDQGKIIYYYQENEGKASAAYWGIQNSSGKYIFNLDADDYFLPNKVIETVTAFEADEAIVHVASPAKIFYNDTKALANYEELPKDISGKCLDGNWLLNYFYENNFLYGGGSTYAAKASTLKKIDIPPGVDMFIDEFLILAILPYGKSFFIKEALSAWRGHSSNYSSLSLDDEKSLKKKERLLRSSTAILTYLQNNNFNDKLIKIYKLKNLNRVIAFKESMGNKKLSDIFNYASNVFINIKPNFAIINNYQVLNRLVPMGLFRLLKKIKN